MATRINQSPRYVISGASRARVLGPEFNEWEIHLLRNEACRRISRRYNATLNIRLAIETKLMIVELVRLLVEWGDAAEWKSQAAVRAERALPNTTSLTDARISEARGQ
jgi:hypothetical protein